MRKKWKPIISAILAASMAFTSIQIPVKAAEVPLESTAEAVLGEERMARAADEFTYLSDLNWTSAQSGWKTVQKDKDAGGKSINFGDGSTYTKGIGTHAASSVVYNLGGEYGRLTGLAGVDNDKISANNTAPCKFQIWGDDKLLWESAVMGAELKNFGPEAFDVITSGVQVLRLDTVLMGTENTSCWTDWADVKLYTKLDETLLLTDLKIGDKTIEGFEPEKFRYTIEVEAEDLNQIDKLVPETVSAAGKEGANISITQAESVPGSAVVTVSNADGSLSYYVDFVVKDVDFLSDLKPVKTTGNAIGQDRDAAGNPIRILGTSYRKGIGMKPDSSVTYNLDGNYVKFLTSYGLNNELMEDQIVKGVFQIKCDGVVRHTMAINLDDQGWHDIMTEINVEKVNTLELSLTREEEGETPIFGSWGNAMAVKGEPSGTLLSEISLDGTPLTGFADNVMAYEVPLNAGTTEVPTVTAKAQYEDAKVEIIPAEKIPGVTVIRVTRGENTTEYTISFRLRDKGLESIDVTLDHTSINPVKYYGQTGKISVKANLGTGEVLDGTDERVEIRYELTTLRSSGGVEIATVDQHGVITPLKNEAFLEEGMEEAWNGGTGKVTVTVTVDDKTVSKDIPFAVTPFWIDYSKTLVMKMDFHMMARDNRVNMNFGDALEVIKRYDNVTRGIPKIVYMVGWQSDGHDTGYPSWDEVDEYLKIPGMTAKESLDYLMQEAKKYNTTVSFHLNMTATYTDSPLYDEYYAKDIIGRREDGGQTVYGEGGVISYTRDWEMGTMQRRMERLVETYPTMAEGHTVHSDAFHVVVPQSTTGFGKAEPMSQYAQDKYGYSRSTDIETMRKAFQYWRTLGLDLTSEFVDNYRPSDVSGNEAFIGLQAMAWHFRKADVNWNMEVPATLYTGGDGGSALFGTSHNPEGSLNPGGNPASWLSDFATTTLPWQYLNHFDRISATDTFVQFSDGVTTENTAKGVLIKENGKILAEGTDYFIPALWNEDYPEIMAYSKSGYQNRTWEFPKGWEDVKAVDVYEITDKDIAGPAMANVDISQGKITLSAGSGKGYTIVPAGTNAARTIKQVTGVTIAEEMLNMNAGDTKKLHAHVLPENATDQGIRYSSSNPEVAEVSNAAIVTAKTEGTAVITGTTVDGQKTASCTVTVTGNMARVGEVKADKESGSYNAPIQVSLSTLTEDADIFYTLDGTEPDETSLYYSDKSTNPGPLSITKDTVIKAVARKDGMIASDVNTWNYQIENPGVAAVRAIAQPDHYTSTQAVFLTSETADAEIYFTIDGTEPSRDSKTAIRYNTSSPLTLNSNTTVKAIAYKDGMASEVKSFAYTFTDQTTRVQTPYAKVNGKPGMGGVYDEPITVEFESRTPDADIYYTTNGKNPSTSSTKYTGPITVDKSMNFKLLAVVNGKTNSNYGWFNFIIGGEEENRVAAAKASLPSGAYKEPFEVKLSTDTPGAVVRYTISGRTPRLYTATYQESIPLIIDHDTTLTAVSYKDGMMDGSVQKFYYTIDAENGAEVKKTAAAPTASVKPGTYEEAQQVALATITKGAEIHYTTDGTNPTETSSLYTEPITVAEYVTIKAIAIKEGYENSSIASFTYEIRKKDIPVTPGEHEVYLSDLDWKWVYAGTRSDTTPMFGDEANLEGQNVKLPKKDMRYEGSASWSPTTDMYLAYDMLKGVYSWTDIESAETTKKVDKGIGTCACSEIVYALGGEYSIFRSVIGFDASVLTNKARPSSVQFKVLGSKTEDTSEAYETLYDSGVVYTSDSGSEERPYFVPQDIQVSVEGYQYLKLWVSDAGETGSGGANAPNQSDAVNWAYARVEKTPREDVSELLGQLQESVDDAEKLAAELVSDKIWETVDDSLKEALHTALAEAKAVLEQEKPEQQNVTEALDKLKNAILDLKNAKPGSGQEPELEEVQQKAEEARTAEQEAKDEAEKALTEAKEARNEADAAKEAAEASKAVAMEAVQSAEAAKEKAAAAQSKANAASQAAGEAERKVAEAKSVAQAAKTAAEKAKTDAGAQKKAQEAETAARTAEANAQIAKSAAEIAKRAAETANNAAEAAQSKAEAAKRAAELAQSKAEEAQGKAEAAEANAETAKSKAEEAQRAAEKAAAAVDNFENDAQQAASDAAQALKEALQANADAKQAASDAAQANADIVDIKREALQAKAEAETAENDAKQQAMSAETAEKSAELALTAAETAKGAAETAWKLSEAAKDGAEAAVKLAEANAKLKAAENLQKSLEEKIAADAFKAGKATLKSVTSKKQKQAVITWKKVTKAEGYVIQYATNSKFKKAATTKIKNGASTKKTLKKLKRKKKYYFRIKAYRTSNGKTIYTKYSGSKTVTIK